MHIRTVGLKKMIEKVSYCNDIYSRASVMWTPKGWTKSVHNSEVSTLVKLGVAMGHRLHTMVPFLSSHKGLSCTCGKGVHRGGVSTKAGCPQGEVLLRDENSTLGPKTTVQIGEVSTVHTSEPFLIGLYKENKRAGQKSVHMGGVSTKVGCPQGGVLLYFSCRVSLSYLYSLII